MLNHLCFSRRDSISHSALETQSNAYATINKLPMAGSSRRSLFNGSLDITDHNESRDYATLEKSYRYVIKGQIMYVSRIIHLNRFDFCCCL